MKKILIAGIAVLFAMSAVTCDIINPEEELGYTDVVYSKDGSEVTVYLDGVGVPVTKSMRAMSKDLAEMAFDFLEVIFVSGSASADVARASWELGEPAGISGIKAGLSAAGFDYGGITAACMFVGKSAGKTLLGIGKITSIESPGSGGALYIGPSTTSVTFGLAAIQTGLKIDTETVPGTSTTNPRGVLVDSFSLTGAVATFLPLGSGAVKTSYPLYTLSVPATAVDVEGSYKFELSGGNPTTYWNAVKIIAAPKPYRREPRFMDGGTYRQPKGHTDTKTTIALGGTAPTANSVFNPSIPLVFNTKPTSGGLLSFYIETPVYMVSNLAAGKNDGPKFTKWFIRTGYGPDLYNLDEGASAGGCVLIGLGSSSDDWIDIIWEWVANP